MQNWLETMRWQIDPLTSPDEIDDVLAVEEASFTNPWTREMYLSELENRGVSFCYLARDGAGRVVGFCSFWRVLDELHINNLAVLPAMRREGVASALLTRVLQEGKISPGDLDLMIMTDDPQEAVNAVVSAYEAQQERAEARRDGARPRRARS